MDNNQNPLIYMSSSRGYKIANILLLYNNIMPSYNKQKRVKNEVDALFTQKVKRYQIVS